MVQSIEELLEDCCMRMNGLTGLNEMPAVALPAGLAPVAWEYAHEPPRVSLHFFLSAPRFVGSELWDFAKPFNSIIEKFGLQTTIGAVLMRPNSSDPLPNVVMQAVVGGLNVEHIQKLLNALKPGKAELTKWMKGALEHGYRPADARRLPRGSSPKLS